MAVDSTPQAWLGKGYALTSNFIKLGTATNITGTSLGTFTTLNFATDDVLTVSGAHYLLVGDIVRVSSATTLPAGLSAATDYYVLTTPSTTTLTLSATNGGAVVAITGAGTGAHTITASGVLKEVTDTEAAAATGDIRKVLWGLNERLWLYWSALPSADRPARMTMRKSSYINSTTNRVTASYTIEFVLEATVLEVVNE
jgi:hypothetical protein